MTDSNTLNLDEFRKRIGAGKEYWRSLAELSRDDCGFGGGSEAANAVCPGAVAAAFFDATGVAARRIPLTPGYAAALLQS